MKKFYTKTRDGVRCIRCRDHFGSIKELAAHYASGGECLSVLMPQQKAAA